MLVNITLVFHKEGLQNCFVNSLCSVGRGPEHPDIEEKLHEMVEGNDAQNPLRHIIEHSEESIHHPISQPLRIVVMVITFNRLEGSVSRVEEPYCGYNEATSEPESHEQNYDSHCSGDENSGLDSDSVRSFLNKADLSELFADLVELLLDSLHLYLTPFLLSMAT